MSYKEFKEIFESNEDNINELKKKIIDLKDSFQEYYKDNFENNTYIKS